MRFWRLSLPLLALALNSELAMCQQFFTASTDQTVQRDVQGLSVLQQVLAVAGGVPAISAIRDFVASGDVTYYWGDDPIRGTATIRGRGIHQFRLDAVLDGGSHSWVVNEKAAYKKSSNGETSALPSQNLVKPATTILPILQVLASLQDASVAVSYGGLVVHNEQQVHDICVQKVFPRAVDPTGALGKISKEHIFVSPDSFTILSIVDAAYRRDGGPGEAPHEIQFSNYQVMNGVLVPTTVTELIAEQKALTIQLSEISFNNSLSDDDFE